jgi:glycosyltransferase involved in cell wall biosynthesis
MGEINPIVPLVSILIPVYNNEKYLGLAIESAISQSWPLKEIIVVDDGSTDNSLIIAKSFEKRGIKIISQSNKGASAARNRAFKESEGVYIQFLDSDDQLSSDKIENQVKALNNETDKVAVCSTTYFFENILELDSCPPAYEESFIYTTDDPVSFMINLWGGCDLNASMIQPNAWLTPRNLINHVGGWNEKLTLDDDGEFFARIVLNSKGIVKCEGLNFYRKYSGLTTNLSSHNNKKALESSLMSVLLKKEYLFKLSKSDYAKKAIFKQLTELSIQCFIMQPELYEVIKKELKEMPKYKYHPVIGGHIINTVSRIIGWKAAKKIQYYLNQIFKSKNSLNNLNA